MKPVTLILIAGGLFLFAKSRQSAPAQSTSGDSGGDWLSELAGPTVAGWIDNLFGGADSSAESGETVGDADSGFGGYTGESPDLGDYSLTPPSYE